MKLNRREFLRPFAIGAASAVISSDVFPQEKALPPHADKTPETPFDAPEGSWTLAVFPDSQNLTKSHPEVFIRQAEWVAAHKDSHNIKFVAHLGDITDNNWPEQWENARKACAILNHAQVPYSLLPGNHDLGKDGKANDRSTLLNEYFSAADYKHSDKVLYFEPDRLENTAHIFNTPGGKFMIIALEFGPRSEVLNWADKITAAHADHTAIVSSHAHIYHDSTRYNLQQYGEQQKWNPRKYPLAATTDVNDGEGVWEKLLSRHANIRFMLNGHVLGDGTGYLASDGKGGQKVHQILSNYQAGVEPRRPYQGGGYFRLMHFLPDKKSVHVKTYSPWFDEWLTTEDQQFEIQL